jgi:hypothetical protein
MVTQASAFHITYQCLKEKRKNEESDQPESNTEERTKRRKELHLCDYKQQIKEGGLRRKEKKEKERVSA